MELEEEDLDNPLGRGLRIPRVLPGGDSDGGGAGVSFPSGAGVSFLSFMSLSSV